MRKYRRPGRIAGDALKHFFKKPATVAYPVGELQIDANYRGKLLYDSSTCIGCNICVRDCPASAIKVKNIGTKEDKKFEFTLNLAHCIFCCQCVDSCPKKSLSFSPDIELGSLSMEELNNIKL